MPHTEAGSESVSSLPIIDVHALVAGTGDQKAVAEQIRHACLDMGFFYIKGHGVDEALQDRLEQLSRQFFAQDLETKQELLMERAGRAWRGYFPVGGELTAGRPDLKEGLYFGAELRADDPRVQAGVPLHGANLFPANIPEFRETVLAYMAALTQLGQTLMQGIALSLGLEASYFADRYTADPLILFRIFNYPPDPANVGTPPSWGVGEHTDYGLLTILKQDDAGGLEVKSKSGWIAAPPVPGTFVCNIGDMLDRMTGGRYRSTPHRVRNTAGRSRLSFPFFFDPNFDAEVKRIESPDLEPVMDDQESRWDRSSVHAFTGTYGDYLLNKVGKVFPALGGSVI
ncbi:isopenicillin N synthase family dioxygenase [Methylocaldum gracile]|jgi:isopenicillin N synthase-like dioxygenase|uniref:isopenicillin N synthase family dioxygenase n=1 Tax=Methylocaldum sp. 0917 TaxID=2485163 RepID=UPI00105B8744